jgi:acetylglutamate kinase
MQQLIVVKVGGNIIDDAIALEKFIEKFASIDTAKILIHGGGKLATDMATKMQIPQQMIEGRRDYIEISYHGLCRIY